MENFAGWTVDPFIEEFVKVAPLLWLAWRRPRIHRQLGYTDHLLYGAALGMGFELLEAGLRYARLTLFSMHINGQYVVDGGLFGVVTVPSVWQSLFTWQPVPAATEALFSSGGDTGQHLVWTALAAVGIAWLARSRGRVRLCGLVPLLLVAIDHANYNMRTLDSPPLAGSLSDVIAWIGGQLPWLLVVVLVVAVVADRIIQYRGRRGCSTVLLPGESVAGLVSLPGIRSAIAGFPFSAWVAWQFVLSRRAAMAALTAGETSPQLYDGVASTANQLTRIGELPATQAKALWRAAVKRLWDGVDLSKLRSPKMLIWAITLLPAVLYLVVGAFPITGGLQNVMTSQVGLWLMVAGVLVGGALTMMQLQTFRTALRAVGEPSLHERRLRLQARYGTALAALGGSVLMVVLTLAVRDPSAHLVSEFHVLEAISDAQMVVGLALILASFFLFPPLGLVAVAGGELALVTTAAAGSFAIAATAGATLASAGYLMRKSAGRDGGSSSGGGGDAGKPPRFTSNVEASRTYGRSVSDIKGQAERWARARRRDGYQVSIGRVRYGKYGHADVTVKIERNGDIKHIRHFIYKG